MICSNDITQLDLLNGKVAEFCRSHDMLQMPCGCYELGGEDYLNIESYITKDRDEIRYEAHREYADIQVMLKGEEIIEVCSLKELTIANSYDTERDVLFYANDVKGESHLMRPGSFIHLLPEDAHMSQLSVDEGVPVKKAVFKIKLHRNLDKIRFLVMDVDGTMTDGRVFVGATGEMFKGFDIKDGLGIAEILPQLGIVPVVITGRQSEMLAQRCVELSINDLHQGVCNKLAVLRQIVSRTGENLSSVCYIGDDLNDLECIKAVSLKGGYVVCPKDAVGEVKASANYILSRSGGKGAIREIIDILKTARCA